uniref:Uncharacterized protein n=1 Tax=Anguilla anguilla TaxID=7936 RepID=A0A0E9USS0_ANGAN
MWTPTKRGYLSLLKRWKEVLCVISNSLPIRFTYLIRSSLS